MTPYLVIIIGSIIEFCALAFVYHQVKKLIRLEKAHKRYKDEREEHFNNKDEEI